MITKEKKEQNITCTGRGRNCEKCNDSPEKCVDYTKKELIKCESE